MQKSLLLLLVISVFSGCSMEKRIYQKGFHIEWKKSYTTSINPEKSEELSVIRENKTNNTLLYTEPDYFPLTEINKPEENSVSKSAKTLTDCHEIILRSGKTIKGLVTEVGIEEIKYKDCNDSKLPEVILKKKDVFKIIYSDGSFDEFKEEVVKNNVSDNTSGNSKTKQESTGNNQIKTEGFAIAGLILSIIGFLFPFIGLIGLIFGIVSLNRIKKNPEKFKGRKLALAAIIVGAISLLFVIIIIFMI
jgi:hypothetical protein